MEISASGINTAVVQQSNKRTSGTEDALQKKLDEQLTNEISPGPENKISTPVEKIEAAQAAQQKSTVDNREQEDKRQGRAIDVTV